MTRTRWLLTVLIALLLAPPSGRSASGQSADPQESPPAANVAAPAHSGRETLDYAVEWRLISAGTARFTWTPMPNSAVSASEVRVHIESTGLVSRLFHVDDDYTAMLGQNYCAQSSFLAAREGSRNRETRVVYDTQQHKAEYLEKDLSRNTTVSHQVEIPDCVHDVVGGLMVLRTLRLDPGKSVQVPISDGKKFVEAKIEAQRREEIKTPLGPRNTIRYEAFLFDNVLYKRSGHLYVWLTDDNERQAVQLQVRLQFTIGTITFRLDKVEKS